MQKLRMAMIGAGQIARVTHIPQFQAMDGVEVVGVCDTRLEAAENLAKEFSIGAYYDSHSKLLKEQKPDAVTICVPNKFHCPITLEALEAGCHVLCEKPPAITVQEARVMEETARKKGKLLSYGFHFRHSEQVAFLKRKMQAGEFGTVYGANVQWHRRRGIPGWGNFTNKELQGGGPLIDIGAHMLDVAVYLMDYPGISYVCAGTSDRIGRRGGIGLMGTWDGARYEVEDALFGFVRFENGACLNLETSFAINRKERDLRKVQIFGDKLGASVFPLEIYGEENGVLIDQNYPFLEMRDWHGDSDRNFVKACLGEEPLLVTGEQGAYVQELICALYESARTGKPIFPAGTK